MKILSLAPLDGPGLERIRAAGHLEIDPWNEHVPIRLHSADELAARLAGVGTLIVEADHVPAEVLAAASDLRILGVCRGDPVNVDLEAATAAGIPVLCAPGRNAEAVAELTVGLLIALVRGVVRADADVRAGRWVHDGRIAQQRFAARQLSSMTVGLVGCGAVGREVARRLRALGAGVAGHDPYADPGAMRDAGIEPMALDELLASSDAVSVHAVRDESTTGMIGERELALLRPGAWLVNTARYELVDEDALLAALRDGRLAGAALDHFRHEFLPPDHPLLSMPNVILTPHIGGATSETVAAHTAAMADGIEALLEGRMPAALANPEALAGFTARR